MVIYIQSPAAVDSIGGPTIFISWSSNAFTISSFVGEEDHEAVVLKKSSIFPAGKYDH